MKNIATVLFGLALLWFTIPASADAAQLCPSELAEAKAAPKTAQAALGKARQSAKRLRSRPTIST